MEQIVKTFKMLGILKRGWVTRSELADKMEMTYTGVFKHIRQFKKLGLVNERIRETKAIRKPTEYTLCQYTYRRYSSDAITGTAQALLILDALSERKMGMTGKELEKKTGISLSQTYVFLRALVIAGWAEKLDKVGEKKLSQQGKRQTVWKAKYRMIRNNG